MPRKSGIVEKTRRPPDHDLAQQRLKSYPGEKFPPWVYATVLIILGIMFLPIGSTTLNNANNTYEQKITYDSGSSSDCYISTANEGKICQVTFTFNQQVTGPIYLYYELTNFFQNHRRYYQSYDYQQLLGEVLPTSDISLSCLPLYQNGSLQLNPCGLIANSFFTDMFTINTSHTTVSNLTIDDSAIALLCDVQGLYRQVHGFASVLLTPSQVANSSLTCADVGLSAGCKTYEDPNSQQVYKFSYPNDDTTQYLYETYPKQISPLEGVTNQHFMVWMRTAMFPTFRKLYGQINGSFVDGDELVINVDANYEVDSFNGGKALVISTLGMYGGKNVFLGQVYITVGSVLLALGIAVFVRDVLFKRHQFYLQQEQLLLYEEQQKQLQAVAQSSSGSSSPGGGGGGEEI